MDWEEKEKLIASSSHSSVSMEYRFSHGPLHQPSSAHILSLLDAQATGTFFTVGKQVPLSWNSSDSRTRGGNFLCAEQEMLPLGLSHFPSEAWFIENAAIFSCFGGTTAPFDVSNSSDAIDGNIEAFGDKSATVDRFSNSGCSQKETNEASEEISCEARGESPNSSHGRFVTTKRKRCNQNIEWNQSRAACQRPFECANDASANHLKAKQSSPNMAAPNPSGKDSKEGGVAPKEEYIHVRARRGQATNSHSLAERARREKISERMKLLQDLVPGCSKLTGKAVMLDEIINYVQSLQRQVEFLSMKLAAVNPTMDFSVEGLLCKDLFQLRNGTSSTIGFSPDVLLHPLNPTHQGLIQIGIPGAIIPRSEAFRRTGKAQLPSSQRVLNAWEEDLHKVVQMSYGECPPAKAQDLNGVPGEGFGH